MITHSLPYGFESVPSWGVLLTILVLTVVGLLIHDWILAWRMPPGPLPLPFIGNKLAIPKSAPWIQFEKWSRIYGPVFTLWIGRRPTVVISDPRIAGDLLEKRSNKYSSRPRFVVLGELYWDNASILVQQYNKQWQIRRKLLHQALSPSALRLYKPVQEAEATRLCHTLLSLPEAYESLVDRFASSVVFTVSYGHRVDSTDAQVVRRRLEFMQYSASLNVPGRFLVESLPILKHIPNIFAPWKAEIQRRGRAEAAFNMGLVDVVRGEIRVDPKSVPDSLTKLLLQAREEDPEAFAILSERDFSFIPASLFGAGSDTTSSSMCSGILMLVTNPAVQEAAHAELDAVVGTDRSPIFDDQKKLPYLDALISEILRIRPVAVLGGTPHANSEPDDYQGYYIPKGSTILSNSWAINLNERYYPNPHHFNPLRFLPGSIPPTSLTYLPSKYVASTSPEKGVDSHPSKDGHSSFGWGRRICPGAGLARNSLFIAVAKLLWAFDILPVQEPDGSIRSYDTFAYTEGFNIRPRPFECVIRARSERHRAVLQEEMVYAKQVLEPFSPLR